VSICGCVARLRLRAFPPSLFILWNAS
jgi:hypothetical protein